MSQTVTKQKKFQYNVTINNLEIKNQTAYKCSLKFALFLSILNQLFNFCVGCIE